MSEADPIYVLNRRVRLLQAPGGLRTSLDSVMLAAACQARSGDNVADLGCGVGSAGLCLLARVAGARLTGLDLQGDHIELARQNAALNHVADFCDFSQGDVKDFPPASLGPFDHVICNPPFMEAGTHMISPYEKKAKALGHSDENTHLQDWIDAGFRTLKDGGSLTMIHRADQCDRIIQGFGKKFGGLEIIPLWPRTGEAARRVIIRALKNRKSPAVLHSGLTLHEADGAYTKAADAILRDMKAL